MAVGRLHINEGRQFYLGLCHGMEPTILRVGVRLQASRKILKAIEAHYHTSHRGLCQSYILFLMKEGTKLLKIFTLLKA